MICPHCHQSFTPTPKGAHTGAQRPTVTVPVDTSTLTHAALFAHYKRTAPAADLAFVARCRPDLAATLRAWAPTRENARKAFDLVRATDSHRLTVSSEKAFWATQRLVTAARKKAGCYA